MQARPKGLCTCGAQAATQQQAVQRLRSSFQLPFARMTEAVAALPLGELVP
jgi:hypothetical protein